MANFDRKERSMQSALWTLLAEVGSLEGLLELLAVAQARRRPAHEEGRTIAF